ncbi:hypothetical protein AVEN_58915-1 [Araneus ventricosus]|uniref:Uncharacterized protein n=1 Tax=Araneus ventricosus TaxID=182803 RepID=A0A4Y2ERI4_ARAVE|nr:hypothetical protein AVEN_58915-1 [Araneus ventricosus]
MVRRSWSVALARSTPHLSSKDGKELLLLESLWSCPSLSGEMSVNAWISEARESTSVQFPRTVVHSVRVVGMVRLVGFRTAKNPQVRPRATKQLIVGKGFTVINIKTSMN